MQTIPSHSRETNKENNSENNDFYTIIHLTFAEDCIAEAFQAEAVISHANDKKPIIASYGAGPCVILGGYEPAKKIGFVIHFSHAGEVPVGIKKILDTIEKISKTRPGNLLLDLKGGIKGNPISERTLKAVHSWIQSSKNLSLQIRTADQLESEAEDSKSLAIDTRSGATHDYDPLKDNPKRFRKLTMDDMLRAEQSYCVHAEIKIAYSPACFFS